MKTKETTAVSRPDQRNVGLGSSSRPAFTAATDERPAAPVEDGEEAVAEYRKVRELLLGGEQRQLDVLNHRLEELQNIQKQFETGCRAIHANTVELARRLSFVEQGDEFVARHLTAALQMRDEAGEVSRQELADALMRPVSENLRQQLAEDPDSLAETFEPIVSPAVNRGIMEIFQESGLQKLIRFRPDGTTRLALPFTVLISLVLVTLTGWLVYSIKENLLLTKAADALRAQEGIIVNVAVNPVLGKPRIAGLRDPDAPEAGMILQGAGVSPENLAIDLQPYLSVDTIFAHQREQDRVKELEALRHEIIEAIGDGAAQAGPPMPAAFPPIEEAFPEN